MASLQEFAEERGFEGKLEAWDVPYWRRKHKRHVFKYVLTLWWDCWEIKWNMPKFIVPYENLGDEKKNHYYLFYMLNLFIYWLIYFVALALMRLSSKNIFHLSTCWWSFWRSVQSSLAYPSKKSQVERFPLGTQTYGFSKWQMLMGNTFRHSTWTLIAGRFFE